MSLKKTIAGHFKTTLIDVYHENGTFSHQEKRQEWVEQQDVALGPLEEEAIRAEWDIGEHQRLKPEPLPDSIKIDMLARGDVIKLNLHMSELDKKIADWHEINENLHAICKKKNDEFNEQLMRLPSGTKTC
jgi:hypothetical protein